MKKLIFATAICTLMLSSCKSLTTAQDVRKQEEKATEALSEAHEAMIELATMKEKYSADAKQEELKQMKVRLGQVDDEIKKAEALASSANSAVQANSKNAVKSLKDEKAKLKADISTIENRQVENWAEVKKAINERILALENNVKTLTANLPEEGK